MRKDNEKDQAFIQEVKQKLDWYINDAPADEYDEKAVASLEYLLETLEPTDDFKVDEEKAWVEFKKYVSERQIHNEKKGENPPTTTTQQKRPAFLFRHKGLVAAAILVLLLAVSISTSSEAVRDNGFFHWIKEMTGGREMITVPDSLDEVTELAEPIKLYSRDDMANEWKEWSEIEQKVMKEDVYEWKYTEVSESFGRVIVQSHYDYQQSRIVIGVTEYLDEKMRAVERFDRFDDYEVLIIDGNEYEVGSTYEEGGKIYSISFFNQNRRYFIIAAETIIERAKETATTYKKVLEKNK